MSVKQTSGHNSETTKPYVCLNHEASRVWGLRSVQSKINLSHHTWYAARKL